MTQPVFFQPSQWRRADQTQHCILRRVEVLPTASFYREIIRVCTGMWNRNAGILWLYGRCFWTLWINFSHPFQSFPPLQNSFTDIIELWPLKAFPYDYRCMASPHLSWALYQLELGKAFPSAYMHKVSFQCELFSDSCGKWNLWWLSPNAYIH